MVPRPSFERRESGGADYDRSVLREEPGRAEEGEGREEEAIARRASGGQHGGAGGVSPAFKMGAIAIILFLGVLAIIAFFLVKTF